MWTIINDCGKQLTIHSKIREQVNDGYKIYEIVEVEFDQYHLELAQQNGRDAVEKQHNIISCRQLMKYSFEVQA